MSEKKVCTSASKFANSRRVLWHTDDGIYSNSPDNGKTATKKIAAPETTVNECERIRTKQQTQKMLSNLV